MIKVGDRVIDGTTAEIGTVHSFNADCTVDIESAGGMCWTTNIDNLLPYKPDGNINYIVNRNSFESLCQDMVDVHDKKNADYGDSFGKSIDHYGPIAFLTRASDKFNRAENLLLHPKDQKVEDEKVTDTLMDLASYCVMMVEYLKNKTN